MATNTLQHRRSLPARTAEHQPDRPATPSVLRQGVWSVGTQAAIMLAGIANSIILNRMLHPEGRGQVALAMLWPPLLGTLGVAGWANANAWYVSRFPHKARAVWSSTLMAGVPLSILLVAGGYFLLPHVLSGHETIWPLARWFLLIIPLHIVLMASTSVLEGLGLFHHTAWVRAGTSLGVCLLVVGLAVSGHLTPAAYVGGIFVPTIAALMLGVWMVGFSSAGSWKVEFTARPRFALLTAPYVWATALQLQVDQLLIAALMPPDEKGFGIYVASANVARLLGPATIGLSMVLLPASARREQKASLDLFCRSVRLYLIAALAVTLPLELLASQALTIAYGQAYASGAIILRVSLAGAILVGILRLGISVLQGQGRPFLATAVGVVPLLISFGAALLLLPWLGYVGAALGPCVGACCGLVILRGVLRAELSLAELIPRRADIESLLDVLKRRLGRSGVASSQHGET